MTSDGLVFAAVGEWVGRPGFVADRAFLQCVCEALQRDYLLIVLRLGGGQDCVRGVVADHALHAAVPFGISKELAGFFEGKACALVATTASGEVDPWSSSRVPDIGHGAVATVTVHSASGVNVSLALRSDARMARIALILGSEFELCHAAGVCSVHGVRER